MGITMYKRSITEFLGMEKEGKHIRGRMMEDIILLETKIAKPNKCDL